jgi:hypothetical protein
MWLFGRLFRKPIKEFKMHINLYRWNRDLEKVQINYECSTIEEAIDGAAYILDLDSYGVGHNEEKHGIWYVTLFERRI